MELEFHPLTVARVVDETADARAFVLSVPPSLRERFRYRAGQFLTFEIPCPGLAQPIRRCYSLSSAPGLDAAMRITVKRIPGGRGSTWFVDRVEPGQVLRVAAPDGRFVLDPAAGRRPLCLLGAGSGITPLLSLLKTALAQGERRIRLVYANRDAASIIHRRELDELVAAHPEHLHLHHHLDDERGFLAADDIAGLVGGFADADHYVCGPTGFMDAAARGLARAGAVRERVHFERFVSPLDPDRRDAARAAARSAAAVPAAVPASFVVRLAGTAHTVGYDPALTLLAAAHRAGVRAPSSCEDGYCGTCRARLVSGHVTMRSSRALAESEIDAGKILLCQATPTSAAPLEVECDGATLRERFLERKRPPQPLAPRVYAAVFVVLLFTAFVLTRSWS